MSYRETERTKAVLSRRTLRCTDCLHEWIQRDVHPDALVPECPLCEAIAERHILAPGVRTNKSIAMDIAQKVAEENFGLTNMRDNQRKGDIAAMAPPPIQGAEKHVINMELAGMGLPTLTPEQTSMAGAFWGPGGPPASSGGNGMEGVIQNALQAAPQAAAAARAEGLDPVGLLHEAGAKGLMRMKLDVIAAADKEGNVTKAPKRPAKRA